ncbi:MAG: DUF2859 domain-containing protein [Flavobacteriales bacterium]|nr:DUF2859 domain-containing protein [Flavobacteriales bacterium]
MIKLASFIFLSSVVIADFGSTVDLKHYIGNKQEASKPKQASIESVSKSLENKFPLNTKMNLGKVEQYEVSDKFKTLNMALISDEPAALNWLNRNYDKLKSSGAIIALIKVDTLRNYQQLNSIVTKAGLNLALLDSSIFDGEITSYPVLIQNGMVTQ